MRSSLSCSLMAVALLCACSAQPEKPARPAAAPARAVPGQPPSPADNAIRAAQTRVDQAKKSAPGWSEGDDLLKEARAAAASGNAARAVALAHDAQHRADLALDGQYLTLSAQKLHSLYALTGLSDAQLAKMREAEVALVRGDGAHAYQLLDAIDREVKAGRTHKVAPGESLWTIAGRDDVYANSLLWPLVWDANRDQVKDPNRLYQGQVLKIRPNPTVDEVVRAVDYARQQMGAQVKIGEVRPAKP
ncbi:MAG TPA: LysM domain-containing protein [Nevskiaceae bacterium]|nr:LysM domain-containing protein [Nevskiaceae bacterium]